MKESLHQITYDTTTAVSAGGATAYATSNHHEILILLATLFAPVVRDVLINLVNKIFKNDKSN